MPDSLPQFEVIEIPVRIGLVADTHRRSGAPADLPPDLLRDLGGCDLILHAGDFNSMAVIDELQSVAPVRGVYGNNDELEVVRSTAEEAATSRPAIAD